MIKQHNGRSVPQRTSEGTASNQNSGDQNPPIISNHNKDLYGDESQTTMVLHLVTRAQLTPLPDEDQHNHKVK